MRLIKRMARGAVVMALLIAISGVGASWAQSPVESAESVTVVVEVTLAADSTPAEALVALNEMRAMMRRQPGFLSEEVLQNLNANNAPRYVHLSRWAALVYWAALFRRPEFSQLNAHGNAHYTLSVSAFQPLQ